MKISEINEAYEKLWAEAQKIVLDRIQKFSEKHRVEIITNGPWGMMITKYSETPKEGYLYSYNRYCKEIKSERLEKLVEWYEDKFGPLPQEIYINGVMQKE